MPENIYDYSRPFDVHTWSEHPQLLEAQKFLYAELFGSKKNEKRYKDLRVVLVDLYKCHLEAPEMYLGYHRGHDRYHADSRYNKIHISFRPLIAVIDALLANGYIEGVDGFINRVTGISRTARMKALPKLINFIECCTEDNSRRPIPPHAIYRHPDEEVIILKDAEKNLMEYVDTPETNRMRDELRAYNTLLENTFIDIDLVGYPKSVRIDTTNKRARRIFNNGTFDEGGRFYGGWWQNVKKELRERIMMGETDKPTIEIDYKAIHINLLYHREGIDYFGTYGADADPYLVRTCEDENEKDIWRNFYKLVLLVCLNSSSQLAARRAVWSTIRTDEEKHAYPVMQNHDEIHQAIEAFEQLHAPITRYFYSGVGLQLQRIDSMIAEKVISLFIREGLPVLCIHDSFICTTRDSNHLEDVIKSAMQETIREQDDEWRNCPITPLTKTTDRRMITQERFDTDNPFCEYTLEQMIEDHDANGSYEPRITKWREEKAQEIISYNI